MFPTSCIPRHLLRALGVTVEFATLGEVRLEPGWEEPAWLEDEGLRREWFREAVSREAAIPHVARASATFRPATAAGRRAVEQALAAERTARPATCSGARGARSLLSVRSPRARERAGAPPPAAQACLWAEG
jgi:hypothetical protein